MPSGCAGVDGNTHSWSSSHHAESRAEVPELETSPTHTEQLEPRLEPWTPCLSPARIHCHALGPAFGCIFVSALALVSIRTINSIFENYLLGAMSFLIMVFVLLLQDSKTPPSCPEAEWKGPGKASSPDLSGAWPCPFLGEDNRTGKTRGLFSLRNVRGETPPPSFLLEHICTSENL